MLLKERSGAFRLRILVLSLAAHPDDGCIAGDRAAVSTGQRPVFDRAQLVQQYDGEHLGRFDRHRSASR
jgi:hypothetical protein